MMVRAFNRFLSAGIVVCGLILSGYADGPMIQVLPAVHEFGFVDFGITVTQTFLVVNSGRRDLDVGTVSLVNGNDLAYFAIITQTVQDVTLAPYSAATGSVTITFSPSSPGDKAVTLQIASNDPEDPVFGVPLYGTGHSGAPAEDLFEQGLAALAVFRSDAGTTNDLLAADTFFEQALAADPDHPGAILYRLLTRFFVLPYDAAVAAMLSDLGMPEEGRNLGNWTATFPKPLPTNAPPLDAVVELAIEKIEAAIESALADLARIPTGWSGCAIFSPLYLPIDNAVQVDSGDARMFEAVLHAARGIARMIGAHDWHASFDVLQDGMDRVRPVSEILDVYPALGTLTNASGFAGVADHLIAAIDRYHAGSTLIRAETDWQGDDLFVFDPDALEAEALFRQTLSQFRGSLEGNTNDVFQLEFSQLFDLRDFFNNPASLRDCLGGVGLQGILGSVILRQVDQALSNLDQAGAEFRQTLSPDDAPVPEVAEVDAGDLWMVRVWLQALESIVHIIRAYNLDDAEIAPLAERDPFLFDAVLDDYANLLTVKDPVSLVSASNALKAALSSYQEGADFLRDKAGERANDVFAVLENQLVVGRKLLADDEGIVRDRVAELLAAMDAPVYITHQGSGFSFQKRVNLGRFFVAPYVTRAHLPALDAENRAVAGTLPDPTFNGIFPGMASEWHWRDWLGLTLADTHGIGIPDAWQSHYFPELNLDVEHVDPAGDADGDGLTNLAEYLARTDPRRAESVLDLVRPVRFGPDDPRVDIRWRSAPYRRYVIESTLSLGDPQWTVEAEVAATPPVNTYTGSAPSGEARFFRVRLIE